MPSLQTVLESSDSEDNSNSDGEDTAGSKLDAFWEDKDLSNKIEFIGLDDKAYTHTFVATALSKDSNKSLGSQLVDIKLFDSGCLPPHV
ncbi:hypothetical protein H0H87_006635 [Tephrocybe sp. NHM501043]|nr:hypothetical protein H0H87_006635 [Tephrocybe sp. NHM501043]